MVENSFILERLGAFPSPWDPRHYRVRCPTSLEAMELPDEFDGLLEYHDKISWYNQGNIGSCVGWCNSIAMEITNALEDKSPVNLSAGWIYQKSREYGGVPWDVEGSTNIGAMKALRAVGAATEELCPTDIVSPFEFNPLDGADEVAKLYAIDSYWNVTTVPTDMKGAIFGLTHTAPYLMPDGSTGRIPLVTAFPVYDSFKESFTNGGVVPQPSFGEILLGGHSSVIRGWKIIDGEIYWINTGSWGKDVGDNGTFYLPLNYQFYDAWIIHNGPCNDDPGPTPSTCIVGKTAARIASVLPWIGGRRGRFYYWNPRCS